MKPVIVTNAGNLSGRMKSQSAKYVAEVKQAQKDNAALVLQKVKQFSAQRFFSLPQLRSMGHPYAVRDPRPPVKPHIINRQSGAFYGAWHLRVLSNAQGVFASVYNSAPWARYMVGGGKSKMIARPILDEALRRTQAQRDRNLRNARRRGYYRVAGK